MVIARIPDTVPDAPDRTIAVAHKAQDAGWQHVTTGWDPQHQVYTVTADQPADKGH